MKSIVDPTVNIINYGIARFFFITTKQNMK